MTVNHAYKPLKNIPPDTYQAAREIYNLENVYLTIGDRLEQMLDDIRLDYLDPTSSLAGESVIRAALVTAFQYAESLPDLAASEAVQKRMDWKYALRLPLKHPGITALSLCNFRQNLKDSPKAIDQFGLLLQRLGNVGLYARISSHPLEPLAVLFSICQTTRFSLLHQGMKTVLGMLVSCAPDWMREHALPHWYIHYTSERIPTSAVGEASISLEEANTLGTDILVLLDALERDHLSDLLQRAEIQHLSRLWEEQYRIFGNDVQWRLPGCLNCSSYRQGVFR